jgi:hypothetical protein
LQEHHYHGPKLAALTENLSQTDYIPTGTGKRKGYNPRRTPPSKLAIYQQQIFYEPQTDGVMGTTRGDRAELDPYQKLLDRLDVDVDDQVALDEDTGPEIDYSDTSTRGTNDHQNG